MALPSSSISALKSLWIPNLRAEPPWPPCDLNLPAPWT